MKINASNTDQSRFLKINTFGSDSTTSIYSPEQIEERK